MLRETNPKTKAPLKFAKLPALGIPIVESSRIRQKEGRFYTLLTNGRRIQLARYIMTQLVGAELPAHLHVHHKDGNKLNDSPDNLELLNVCEHSLRHAQEKAKKDNLERHVEFVCACGCGRSKRVPGWKFRSNEKRGRKNVFEHSCATRLGNQKRLGVEV